MGKLSMPWKTHNDDVTHSNSSRRQVYKVYSSLVVHNIYRKQQVINEHHRIALTDFWVSGHSLCCETGRWNRQVRGKLPPEEWLCACSNVQTKRHIVQDCPMTHSLRRHHSFITMEDTFSNKFTDDTACKVIYDILKIYDALFYCEAFCFYFVHLF